MKRILTTLLVSLMLFSPLQIAAENNGNVTVYITKTGECYHTSDCKYLSESKISITLQEAVKKGYRACSRCKPPTLKNLLKYRFDI